MMQRDKRILTRRQRLISAGAEQASSLANTSFGIARIWAGDMAPVGETSSRTELMIAATQENQHKLLGKQWCNL